MKAEYSARYQHVFSGAWRIPVRWQQGSLGARQSPLTSAAPKTAGKKRDGTAWWARTTDPQIHNLVL